MTIRAFLAELHAGLPSIDAPFSVLIDSNEPEWRDAIFVQRLAKNLLALGCRYFVCFGKRSELVHDLIDDVILDEDYEDVMTTFHVSESRKEVLEFLLRWAASDMKCAVILVRDSVTWEKDLRRAKERIAGGHPPPSTDER